MLVKESRDIVGGMSVVSKMPKESNSYGLSAHLCNVGGKLVLVPGSVCEYCYALEGQYEMGNVIDAHARREQAILDPRWPSAMSTIVERKPLMRWFDSGDIRSLSHLIKIVAVAHMTPDTKHWLPTKEYGVLSKYERGGGKYPGNLVVRPSAPMIDTFFKESLGTSSGVMKNKPVPEGVYVCPAHLQDNKCGDCRACWDPEVKRIAYEWHSQKKEVNHA